MTAFFEAYLDADYTDRGLLTKEWMKGNRVSRITRTASGANAGGGNKTDRNPNLVHTLDTLDVEIAAATLPMDFNIYEIPRSVYRRAKEVVLKKESPFKEWSAALRATPGILDYSRAAIFALIRSAHPEFYHYPGRLQGYINAYLTETDHENPSKETLTVARHTPEKDILEEINLEVVTERETEEKPQPSDAMAGERTTTETMEPDTTEHSQDAQSLDAQSQVSSANQVKVTADEVNKIMQAANINQPDADKLLAASRGEFVAGISDPNDPKWVKGIETRDSVNQNQQETEQNDQKAEQNSPNTQQNEPETKLPEPVVQQEVEKVCTACGQTGGGNCPDCGAVMGDATYQETFDEEYQVEVQEDDPEEMEGAEHPHKENAGSAQDHASDNETGETADSLIAVNGHHVITSTSRVWYHLMIDLETMGTNTNAPIVVIGAVFFDPQTGEIGPVFYIVVSLTDAMNTGAVPDGGTIEWWLKQSSEARAAILTDQVKLRDALSRFREFINEYSDEKFVQVWGNGATFDNAILRTSYERLDIPCPWRYYNDRDVRTIVELGKTIDFDARTVIPFEGVRHNALDDARHQAKYVTATIQKLIPNPVDF
ncbi:3'-5' exoribonuclease [Escherichia coli]